MSFGYEKGRDEGQGTRERPKQPSHFSFFITVPEPVEGHSSFVLAAPLSPVPSPSSLAV
jgi:hypothetical protein